MMKKNIVKAFGLSLAMLLANCSTQDDMQVENTSSTNVTAKSSNSTQLSIVATTASAQHSNTYAASKATDGSLSTRWTASGTVYLYLDLGSAQLIDYVKMAHHNGNKYKYNMQFHASNSLTSGWQLVGTKASPATTNALYDYDLTNSTYRYLRVTCTGNTNDAYSNVTEIQVWGTASGTSTGGGTTTGSLDPSKAPSANFDLSKWYLSIPINNGSGVATSISVSDLNNGFQNSTYFYTGSDGGMVFVNYPKNAYKTSTNTSYSRTELREMLDTNANTSGINKNNWVFSSSSSSNQSAAGGVGGNLTATLAVNRVTTTATSSVQYGRTIVGQIHASSNEPCRLYYHKLPDHSKGAIYFAHEDASGNEAFYNMIGSYVVETGSSAGDLNGSPSSPSDGIALNEKFSYTINVTGTTLKVTISRDGKSDIVKSISMANSGYANDWMYFKAGIYTQNKTATSTSDYDKATFYALKNTH